MKKLISFLMALIAAALAANASVTALASPSRAFSYDISACDVNGDGMVNITDLNAVLNALQGFGSYGNCDVNSDGVVNYIDYAWLFACIMQDDSLTATEDQCDFNGDGKVDGQDWDIIFEAWKNHAYEERFDLYHYYDEDYEEEVGVGLDYLDLGAMAMLLAELAENEGPLVLAFSENEIWLSPGESKEVHLVLVSLDESMNGFQMQFTMYDANHNRTDGPVRLDSCYNIDNDGTALFHAENISSSAFSPGNVIGNASGLTPAPGIGDYRFAGYGGSANNYTYWNSSDVTEPMNVFAFTITADEGWDEDMATFELDRDWTMFVNWSNSYHLSNPLVLTIKNRTGDLPKTDAPVITIENTENGTVVTMIAEEGGDIYYCVNKDFGDFSEWTQYTGELLFNASGYYNIQAYAIADGKTASDIVTCSFIVQALPKTDAPVITSETTDDVVIVTATGNGEVKLYKNGIEVENPCTVARTDADQEYTFTATAKEEGKQISETAYLTVYVPAREEPLEEGYKIEKMWSFDDLSFMTTGDVRQGFGMNGKFYINNKASQKVIVVDKNGLANVEYPGGANCGITRDKAGNLVISNASFPNAWTASTTIKVVNPETNEVKEYVVPEECGISGRCDFIGFAKGNLMEDGVLYLTGAANSGISVMTITGGEVNIDECYIAACNGLSPSTSTVINYYTDLYGGEALLYVTRNATPLKIAIGENGFTATTISLPKKSSCNGMFPFVWEGKEYYVYPTLPNYLNGFAVAEAGAAAPLVEVPPTFTSNQNAYTCNWLNAEINNDGTVTVYQYYPGGNITVYKLSNGSTPAMEVTPMPEISYELTDDAVIVTATGNGVVKLYKGGVEVENPCIVPRTYVNQSIQFYATAQEEGKLISEGKTAKVTVPALPFYIVGNAPFGDWDPGAGVEMTSNGDVTYSYEATLDGDVWFVFANGLDPDWDVFNSNYRLAPLGSSDLYIYEGEWNDVYRVNNSVAFQFTGVGAKYTITLDPANMRFKIEFKDWALKTDPPVITSETTDDAVIVTATGNGEVKLYKEGIEVENPCIIPRTYTSQDIEFYATAQEEGKLVSDKNYVWIYVPAKQYAINEADLAILTEFYNQYGNSSFTWSLALDDFYCEGVTVENERVVAIELPSISLVGAFPTMLLGLSQLHTLDLSYNNLSGDVASDIQDYVATHGLQAANLQHLYVNNNKFEGNVGALAAQFSSLATLCARTNYFNDVNPMVDPQVSLDLSDQLLQVDADITSGLESMRESLPAICRYDHENQRFSSDINVYLTAEQQGCPWQLYVYNNNQSVVETYGNTYYGGNGQIVSGQTWLYGSWSNEQRLQAKFTFAAGDANMNGPVDITDLQAMVLYIFGEYNKPFNYTAANLNNDNTVNVQDAVGEANLLLSSNLAVMSSGGRRMPATNDATQASLYWENGVLYLYSTVPVAALDIINSVDGDIKWSLGARGMVVVNAPCDEGEHSVIYSLSDGVIPAGLTAIATATDQNATVVSAMLSDTDAELVSVKFNESMTGLTGINSDGGVSCYMEGSDLVINSGAALRDVDVTIYSIDGRIVDNQHLSSLNSGRTKLDVSNVSDGNRYLIIVVRSGRQILATQKLTQNK